MTFRPSPEHSTAIRTAANIAARKGFAVENFAPLGLVVCPRNLADPRPSIFLEDAGDGWLSFVVDTRTGQIHLDNFPAWLRVQLGIEANS